MCIATHFIICLGSLLKRSQVVSFIQWVLERNAVSNATGAGHASSITTLWLSLRLYGVFGVSLSRHRPGSCFYEYDSISWMDFTLSRMAAMTLDTNLASHFYSILFHKCFFLSLFWDHVHVLSRVQISCGSFSAPVSEMSARLKTGDIFS